MPAQIGGRTYSNGQLLIGGGLVLALINWFIPWWWGFSSSYTGSSVLGIAGTSYSGGTNGFGLWSGWLGFIVLLVLIVLFAIRTFAPQTLPALPVQDFMIYTVGGVFIALMTILFLTYAGGASYSGPGYNFSAGISIGFFVGLILAIAIAVGGWLSKSDVQPATAPMNFSAFNQSPPPPPPAQ
ncbi:MAG: hypothetical protein ABSH07_06510 [Candidatus Dormibacteria bacterium]|jgi:Na+(H+)/acetate symporter ActP